MRTKSDWQKTMTDGQIGWLHRIGDRPTMPRPSRVKERRVSDGELHDRLALDIEIWHSRARQRNRLAAALGMSRASLDELIVGWDGQCWTFPEKNHRGLYIGVNRRHADGQKMCLLGSRRGLSYVAGWADRPGPILICEGGSDVAAGVTMGLCMIGRPSNTGGVEYLVKMLGHYLNRKMVVLAERDRKASVTVPGHTADCPGCALCWPGKFGARSVAERLSKRLNRIVAWRFLPDGAKDIRAWLVAKKLDPENEQVMRQLGASLLRRL